MNYNLFSIAFLFGVITHITIQDLSGFYYIMAYVGLYFVFLLLCYVFELIFLKKEMMNKW